MFSIRIGCILMNKSHVGTQRFTFKPFEDESHLECICRLALKGREVGAYLLNHRHQYSFVFGFQAAGIHTLLAQGQAEVVLKRLEEGLKGLRAGDRLRLHLRSFSDDAERQQELDHLVKANTSLESQFLLLAQQRATRELTLKGERQSKQLYLFATYTIEPGKESASDRLEKLVAWFIERYETFKGMKLGGAENFFKPIQNIYTTISNLVFPLIFCRFSIINLIENNEFTGFQEFSAPLRG